MNIENNELITYEEYKKIFEKDENGSFINLIIPAEDNLIELNLIGKLPSDYSLDEIIRMKKYARKMFDRIDKNTMNIKNDNNNKFVYQKGEIVFSKSLCDLCKYNNSTNKNSCSQFLDGKPNSILNNEKMCDKYKSIHIIDLES